MTRRPLRRLGRSFAFATLALLSVACAPRAGLGTASIPPAMTLPAAATDAANAGGKIKHVVVIVQENRSFDNMFYGYPGADTVKSGKNSQGQTIALQPVSLEVNYGIEHLSPDFFVACDGSPPGRHCKMDGFDKEAIEGLRPPPNPQFGYVPPNESAPYFAMAHSYVLADKMFASQIDASFTSHQYIIAGQAHGAVDLPTTVWGCGGGSNDTVPTLKADRTYGPPEAPCFDSTTLGDELDKKGLAWRYYASASSGYYWIGYLAIDHIFNGPDWSQDVVTPSKQFLTDVGAGQLAAVTWITPDCIFSDHSGCMGNTGPQWVASVVNAVGQSKFWNTTTVFVMWDEWGGWYDHVAPAYLDYDGLGFRVPLIIISPYAKKNYVSHVHYEHGSILRYIEDTFGLGRLAASDRRANSPAHDAFDFNRKPRRFTPFATQLGPQYFLDAPIDPRPVDNE